MLPNKSMRVKLTFRPSPPCCLPVLPRLGTMGHCLPRPSPGTPTPPHSTAPDPRAWPWVTGREAADCRPAWGPVASPVWESTRWTDPRQRHSHCWLGEHFHIYFHIEEKPLTSSYLNRTHQLCLRSFTWKPLERPRLFIWCLSCKNTQHEIKEESIITRKWSSL